MDNLVKRLPNTGATSREPPLFSMSEGPKAIISLCILISAHGVRYLGILAHQLRKSDDVTWVRTACPVIWYTCCATHSFCNVVNLSSQQHNVCEIHIDKSVSQAT